jgi:putative endonuclease
MSDWILYIARCHDGSLYTGITTDVARRLREHQRGGPRGASYVRGRGPLELLFTHHFDDRSAASRAEYAVKQLSKQAKQRLVAGLIDIRLVADQ